MREDVNMKNNDINFKLRASGVVINNGKVLFVTMDNNDFMCLPGGHVELGETTEEAVLREMREEVNIEFKIEKYLGIVENFFINKFSKKIHEVSFYYLTSPINEIEDKDFMLMENDKGHDVKLSFKWIDLKEFDNYNIRPAFLKDILKQENIEFKHVIINELYKEN